jgi:hypothetical protein
LESFEVGELRIFINNNQGVGKDACTTFIDPPLAFNWERNGHTLRNVEKCPSAEERCLQSGEEVIVWLRLGEQMLLNDAFVLDDCSIETCQDYAFGCQLWRKLLMHDIGVALDYVAGACPFLLDKRFLNLSDFGSLFGHGSSKGIETELEPAEVGVAPGFDLLVG